VFAQAKFAAKKTASLSGLKQSALALQMYSNDFDDMAVPYYGYSDRSLNGDTNQYHYPTAWPGRVFPYTKSQSIYFDKTIPEINNYNTYYQDPIYPSDTSYTYSWSWITTFSINRDGYSRQLYSGSSCSNYGSYSGVARSLSAIDQVSSRLAVTPTRYSTIGNFGWMYFTYSASFPVADVYAATYNQKQFIYDSRKQYGTRFIGAFADGHAANYGPEKFVKEYAANPSLDEATGYSSYCSAMDKRQLWEFWGPIWNGS